MAEKVQVLKNKEKLLRLLECPVCLDELDDPRILSCGHILCYMCVRTYTEKGQYKHNLPCPMCRQDTTLYEGGVDNFPKFFFFNDLRDIADGCDGAVDDQSQSEMVAECSTGDCRQTAVHYCQTGCQFLCQHCSDDHKSSRITKSHNVIPSSEYEVLCNNKCPYPPCHRHGHQVMDLYCSTCNIPICTTCCQANHRHHDCCELTKQAEVCKDKLQVIIEETDGLIDVVKCAMDKTKRQAEHADKDIEEFSDNIKSTFKILHDELNEDEERMLANLQATRRRVKKTSDLAVDEQMMVLGSLENLRSVEVKLAEKSSVYDYVTVTTTIRRDVEKQRNRELPGFRWGSEYAGTRRLDTQGHSGRVEVKSSHNTSKIVKVKELTRISLQNQTTDVIGMAIYNEHIYIAFTRGLAVLCYNSKSGELVSEHALEGGADTVVQGMCLVRQTHTLDGRAKLVVSDFRNTSLVWISIDEDFSMTELHTQRLEYSPRGSYANAGVLMVCDYAHKVHRYGYDGQCLSVMGLPGDFHPWSVTRHGEDGQFIIMDTWQNEIIVIDKDDNVKVRYKGDIDDVQFGKPYGVITDHNDRVLIADGSTHQVLLLSEGGDKVHLLLGKSHVLAPTCLGLDIHNNNLYVAAKDNDKTNCVVVYDYNILTGDNSFNELITKMELIVEL